MDLTRLVIGAGLCLAPWTQLMAGGAPQAPAIGETTQQLLAQMGTPDGQAIGSGAQRQVWTYDRCLVVIVRGHVSEVETLAVDPPPTPVALAPVVKPSLWTKPKLRQPLNLQAQNQQRQNRQRQQQLRQQQNRQSGNRYRPGMAR